jgi:DNA-binding winged helix-turn-helix (wHTH) protein
MSNNILIRNLSEFDQATLGELMALFQEKAASKAIIKLLRDYKRLKEREAVLERLNETLQSENAELRQKIENLRKSLKDIQATEL